MPCISLDLRPCHQDDLSSCIFERLHLKSKFPLIERFDLFGLCLLLQRVVLLLLTSLDLSTQNVDFWQFSNESLGRRKWLYLGHVSSYIFNTMDLRVWKLIKSKDYMYFDFSTTSSGKPENKFHENIAHVQVT